MDQWRKCCIELDYYIVTFEPDWIRNLVAINTNRDDRRINETYLRVWIIRFVSDFFTCLRSSMFLDLLDD